MDRGLVFSFGGGGKGVGKGGFEIDREGKRDAKL